MLFGVWDETGNLTMTNVETRIASAINHAITSSSDLPSTIAQPWLSVTPLFEAEDHAISQLFLALGLDQEAVLFVDVTSGAITVVYHTDGATVRWDGVTISNP
jgi:hypothetical protein